MSVRLMSIVWEIRFPTQSQLLVALKLADYGNDHGGSIFPSKATLADLTQSSESTVKNALRAFRTCGLLQVVKEGGSGPRDTTQYQFNMPLIAALHNGSCKLVGSSDDLTIEWIDKGSEFDPLEVVDLTDSVQNKGSNKGSNSDPLPSLRGQSGPLRGQPSPAKGSKALTPIHQEPLSRTISAPERASDETARAPVAHRAAITVRDGDTSWGDWITHLTRVNGPTAFAATQQGFVVVSSRWPRPDSIVISPVVAAQSAVDLARQTAARMTGERE